MKTSLKFCEIYKNKNPQRTKRWNTRQLWRNEDECQFEHKWSFLNVYSRLEKKDVPILYNLDGDDSGDDDDDDADDDDDDCVNKVRWC